MLKVQKKFELKSNDRYIKNYKNNDLQNKQISLSYGVPNEEFTRSLGFINSCSFHCL